MKTIRVISGNIEHAGTEAIVNAANTHLSAGAGVSGAIFRASNTYGNGELEQFIRSNFPQGAKIGTAVVTPAFDITGSKYIFHAVGPMYNQFSPQVAEKILAATYRSAFNLAYALGLKSIALPAISAGIYGFPAKEVARIAANEARYTPFQGEIIFYTWNDTTQLFEDALGITPGTALPTPATSSFPAPRYGSPAVSDLQDVDDLVSAGN